MTLSDPQVTTREQWLAARRKLLEQEKELTRHRDEVNAARRALPMVENTKDYSFDGPHGRSQMLIYHFMFDPDADEGCKSCSFTMENVGHLNHLYARDTSFAVMSRAPLHKLEHYRQRMGWTFPWYSSHGSDFNYDFHVTLDASVAPVEYNYKDQAELERENPDWKGWSGEEHGVSAFLRRRARLPHLLRLRARHRDTHGHLQLARPHRPRPPGGLGTTAQARRRPLHELAAPPRRIRT
jgi:predicted dithiol-disulfide oxidoreductase (DUF899 family)